MDDLLFQSISFTVFHEELEDEKKNMYKKYCIRIFGRTKKQKSVYLQIENFKPYFFVEIQPFWRRDQIESIFDEVNKHVTKFALKGLIKKEIVESHKLKGFTNNKLFKFMKLSFSDFESMRSYTWSFQRKLNIPAISKKPYSFQIFESNLLPMLRFIHERNLEPVGWISVENKYLEKIGYPITCSELNYKTEWNHVKFVDDKMIEKFEICSYDIECTSVDGSFPQPQRDGDQVIQIGLTYSRFGEPDCYYRHLLSLHETSEIEGTTVEWFRTEKELLLGFTKLLKKTNPDIITGYNIFGFDFWYLMERSKKLGCEYEFSMLSRVNAEKSEWIDSNLSSAAIGKSIMKYYDMNGRVLIDLMKVVQREYKLSSYKLDYVASYFIREVITNIICSDNDNTLFKVITKNTNGVKIGQYVTIVIVEGAVENKYGEGQKFQISEIGKDYLVLDGKINTEEFMNKGFKIFWCQAKDDISPADIFRMFKGTAEERALVGKYCIQDCELVSKLVHKLQVVANNVSMANVCSVPLSFIFLRGQGIKIFSLVAKKCREKNYLIPTPKKKYEKKKEEEKKEDIINEKKLDAFITSLNNKHKDDEGIDEDVGYEGAIVFEPKPAVYYEPIIVLDYASLYPNSMIFRNFSHETFVTNPEYDNLDTHRYHEVSYNNNDGSISTCRFAEKLDGTKGIIPEILMDLLNARKKYRKMAESEPDKFKQSILDCLQLAYKVTANSLYGQCGSSVSAIGLKEIAAATTATGREALKFAKYFVEHIYTKIVNLALDDKKKYYSEMNRIFTYYPDEITFDNRDTLTDEINKETIHVCTDRERNIDAIKFIRPKINYEFDVVLHTDFIKIFNKLQKKYKLFTDKFFDLKNECIYLNFNIETELYKLSIKKRNKMYGNLHNYLLNNSKKLKINNFWKTFDKKKNIKKIFKKIKNMSDDAKTSLLDKLNLFIDNCGFNGKEQMIDKFYDMINKLLNGYHIDNEIVYGDTDSVFFCPHICDDKTKEFLKDKNGLFKSIVLGIWASILICCLLPPPMSLEFEKVLFPFLIQGKKRYAANLYEKNCNKFYLKTMGIEIKRRDNANIVKYVSSGILHCLLNLRDPIKAVEFVRQCLSDIITGKFKIANFIITKTLKGNSLTKKEQIVESQKLKHERTYADRTRLVHVVLADRMAERDAGNRPLSNDRIPYVFIEIKESKGKKKAKKTLQGDHVETPEYIAANNLKIDYLHYITNQIMIPAIKFLDLIIVDAKKNIFNEYIVKEQNRKNNMIPIAYYLDNNDSDNYVDVDDYDNDYNEIICEKMESSSKKNKKQIKTLNHSFYDDVVYDLDDVIDFKIFDDNLKKTCAKKNKKELIEIKKTENIEDFFDDF
jgi:DNA polymerase elongation subunit (family B)